MPFIIAHCFRVPYAREDWDVVLHDYAGRSSFFSSDYYNAGQLALGCVASRSVQSRLSLQ